MVPRPDNQRCTLSVQVEFLSFMNFCPITPCQLHTALEGTLQDLNLSVLQRASTMLEFVVDLPFLVEICIFGNTHLQISWGEESTEARSQSVLVQGILSYAL